MSNAPKVTNKVGIGLVSLLVKSYDEAIEFFVEKLGFVLLEDSPSLTNAGQPKRWVVVCPPGTYGASILLARADGHEQEVMIGKQFAGRVGLFWQVEDFDSKYRELAAADVQFVKSPQIEPFGKYAVFLDVSGNKWDLLGCA